MSIGLVVQCKRKHGVVALDWPESRGLAFLDSEQGIGRLWAV